MRTSRQPYALEKPVFPFKALTALAARAPLGGAREVAIAALVGARLAAEVQPGALEGEDRSTRAAGARRWLSTMTIAEPARRALVDLIAATETDAPRTVAALRRVIEVTGPTLDGAARQELEHLARDLASETAR